MWKQLWPDDLPNASHSCTQTQVSGGRPVPQPPSQSCMENGQEFAVHDMIQRLKILTRSLCLACSRVVDMMKQRHATADVFATSMYLHQTRPTSWILANSKTVRSAPVWATAMRNLPCVLSDCPHKPLKLSFVRDSYFFGNYYFQFLILSAIFPEITPG